jgi:hypothetical protein
MSYERYVFSFFNFNLVGMNFGINGCALDVISWLLGHRCENDDIIIITQDSLLTRLLRNSLGGNAVTLIICTISSLIQDYEESLR